jgi:hypothetical protein
VNITISTDEELLAASEISGRAYRAAVDMFSQAQALYTEMSSMAPWTPQYTELAARAQGMMSAGRQQHEICAEIANLMRDYAARNGQLDAYDKGAAAGEAMVARMTGEAGSAKDFDYGQAEGAE